MGNANYSDWINPKVMDTLIHELQAAKNLSVKSLWLGETGSTWNLDKNGDKFIAGFWWIDKLGLSALYGLDVVVRFTFFGGTWTLISDPPYMKTTPVTLETNAVILGLLALFPIQKINWATSLQRHV